MRLCRPSLFGVVSLCLAVAVPGAAVAQLTPLDQPLQIRPVPQPKGMTWAKKHSKAFFNTNIGSFKILGIDDIPVEGTLDMSFRGTVLISNLEPGSTVVITGDVRKEIDDQKIKKQVYFGKGRITIVGKFRAVQFFGTDLRAAADAYGVGRLIGEFDHNLDTGLYWYTGDPQKRPWSNGMSQLPLTGELGGAKPKVRVQGQGG